MVPLVANPLASGGGEAPAPPGAPPRAYGNGSDPSFRFVRVKGTQLTAADDDAPWYFLGANYWCVDLV